MIERKISLNSFEKVKKFAEIVQKYDVDIDILAGRYMVDGKSIMGLYSLNLHDPLKIIIHADSADRLLDEISEFVVF